MASVATVVLIVGFIGGCGWISAFEKTKGGEVAVIRNGGLFDDNKIRCSHEPDKNGADEFGCKGEEGFLPEASSRTNIGLWSSAHKYPSQQRFYKLSSNADESDSGLVDQVIVPTSDGINVSIEGTVYFKLNTDPAVLRDFDNKFGTRTFGGKHPYDGNEGFSNFLNTIIRPVIDNNLRKEIGSVRGADLNPSLALVQNQGQQTAVDPDQGKKANQRIAEVETLVNEGLVRDIQDQLGGDYLVDIKFTLAKALPSKALLASIERAQTAFTGVTRAEGRLQAAQIDAQANEARQRGYNSCTACARIDAIKALPHNLTALGGNFAVGVK